MNMLIRETKVLFLSLRAIKSNSWSPVLYESLEQLCRSSNSVISRRAHLELTILCGEKKEKRYS